LGFFLIPVSSRLHRYYTFFLRLIRRTHVLCQLLRERDAVGGAVARCGRGRHPAVEQVNSDGANSGSEPADLIDARTGRLVGDIH
jgi:hypothetical protein